MILYNFFKDSQHLSNEYGKFSKSFFKFWKVEISLYSRTVFSIKGSLWRELLAKGTPIDLCPNKFTSTSFRRTRLGQVSTAFWMVKTDQIYIVCGRSFKEFFFKWLCNAANEKSITKFF